jgi:hypothetical protein
MSEAEQKAGELARYFQARPEKASPKHPDVKRITFCAWGAYSGLAAPTKTRREAKTQSRDVTANTNDTGFGRTTKTLLLIQRRERLARKRQQVSLRRKTCQASFEVDG